MNWDLIAAELESRIAGVRASLESCKPEQLLSLQGRLAAYRDALTLPRQLADQRKALEQQEALDAQRAAAERQWSGVR